MSLVRAVDFIVQEQWLVWIHVKELMLNNDADKKFWFLMDPTVTVSDIKTNICRIRGHPPADQRLSSSSNNNNNEEQQQQFLFHGTLRSTNFQWNRQQPDTHISIQLHVVAPDPCLESLFQMVDMGDVEDRDIMMKQLMQHRPVGGCACGNGRMDEVDDWSTSTDCSLCEIRYAAYMCRHCFFAMCRRCHEDDSGRMPALDPYLALENIAKNMGSQMVSVGLVIGGASGSSMGRFGHCPSLVWKPSWGDVKPPKRCRQVDAQGDTTIMQRDRQVLHRGVRLVVERSDEVMSSLEFADNDSTVGHHRKEVLDSVYVGGATVDELAQVQKRAVKHSVTNNSAASRIEPIMVLKHFEVDEIHLELVNPYTHEVSSEDS